MHDEHRAPLSAARRLAGRALEPALRRAARAYVVGDDIADAIHAVAAIRAEGLCGTIGYFNADDEPAERVAAQYRKAVAALRGPRDYLSAKLPALGFSRELLGKVAAEAARNGVRVHFDALWPEAADETFRAAGDLLGAEGPRPEIGVTLPGRWRRSRTDAAWAAESGLFVRVVKGQWPDPEEPDRDMDRGFLEVVEALAGRAPAVAIASHDVRTARASVELLRRAGTPCELELLHGLPTRQSMAMARELELPVRLYVPYGAAHLPYVVSRALEQPRLVFWLLKDLVAGRTGS